MRYAHLSKDSMVRPQFGVRCSVFGVRCSVFGVRCSVFGVRCSVFGVRCSVFDVRCSMFDVRLQDLVMNLRLIQFVLVESSAEVRDRFGRRQIRISFLENNLRFFLLSESQQTSPILIIDWS